MSMIKLFIYTLLAIVTGLLATLFLAREPGYLLVSFADSTFETSLFALFIAIVALLIFLRIVLLILDWINPFRLLRAGKSWSATRSEKRALNVPLTKEQLGVALLSELQQELSKGEQALTLAQLRKLWKTRTKKITKDAELIHAYVDVLEKLDAIVDAIKLLESELDKRWDGGLLKRYSLLALRAGDTTAVQQLQRAEQWLSVHPADAQLLLALGRLSLRNQLWGKAKEYFERSLQEQAEPEVFAELARLLQSLKEPERSAQYLENETRLISRSLPDYPQPS